MPLIRAATIADVQAIARVDVETWRATYAGILPDTVLVEMSTRQRSGFWSRFVTMHPGDLIVAVDSRNQVLGFGSCGMQRGACLPDAGEIFSLYVEPDRQGLGIGRRLLLSLFFRLVQKGHDACVLWVLDRNPSRFFYERLGGRVISHQTMSYGGRRVEACAYAWVDLHETLNSRGRTKKSPTG
jgi:ribosomal protein S18 acetylase RimI-like enzyme